jgi:3-dehydroquinate synthase
MSVHQIITVAAEKKYDVIVGHDLLESILENIDESVNQIALIFPAHVEKVAKSIKKLLAKSDIKVTEIKVPNAESAKNVKVLDKCWNILGKNKFSRTDLIIGIGGGATTDLAGFVAATWLRGIKFISVPTTLLGMVDAAVGGKTGINTSAGKNLVGSFHNPSLVLCDLETLKTLKKHDFKTGMAEVAKCGFIADEEILKIIEKYPAESQKYDGIEIPELITRSIKVKGEVVGLDFKETSTSNTGREILNYGHTLGHAIEKNENYKWRHGDAISVGMVYAAELAHAEGKLSTEIVQRHRRILQSFGLPVSYKSNNFKKLIEIMAIDKKSRSGRLRFVILEGIAKPIRLENPSYKTLHTAWEKVSK